MIIDIFRRQVDIHERNFLRDAGVVTEMQCDLGERLSFYFCMFPFRAAEIND